MKIHIDLPDKYTEFSRDGLNFLSLSLLKGAYVFYDLSEIPLYVGKTKDFRRRALVHSSSSPFYLESTSIRFYEVVSAYEADILETYLISILNPEYNLDKTDYNSSTIDSMISRIDDKITLYNKRESSLLEMLNPRDFVDIYDIYESSDIVSAEESLTIIREELSNLKIRRKRVLLRKNNE